MNKKIIISTTIAGLLLSGVAVFAANNMNVSISDSGSAKIKGTVSAVNGSNITMASWGGSWTINAADAKFVASGTTNASISSIQAGDQIMVQGTASSTSMSITAKTVIDHTNNFKPNTLMGKISNLDASAGTFTVNPKLFFMNLKGNANITTTSSTKVYLDGNTSTMTSLSNDMGVIVFGSWNAGTSNFEASEIRAYTVGTFGFINGKGLHLKTKLKMGGL